MTAKHTYTVKEARELFKPESKGNKFRAKKCTYNDIKMASRLEKRFATRLNMRKMAGEIDSWEYGIEYKLIVNKILICTYVLDFKVKLNDGTFYYYDTKGVSKGDTIKIFRMKRKLMLAIYGIEVKEARFNYETKNWEIK